MTFIETLLLSLAIRYGIKVADKSGWLPAGHYQKKAVAYLEKDEIEKAIEYNLRARRKRVVPKDALVVRDLILMTIDGDIDKQRKVKKSLSSQLERFKPRLKKLRAKKQKLFSEEINLLSQRVIDIGKRIKAISLLIRQLRALRKNAS